MKSPQNFVLTTIILSIKKIPMRVGSTMGITKADTLLLRCLTPRISNVRNGPTIVLRANYGLYQVHRRLQTKFCLALTLQYILSMSSKVMDFLISNLLYRKKGFCKRLPLNLGAFRSQRTLFCLLKYLSKKASLGFSRIFLLISTIVKKELLVY